MIVRDKSLIMARPSLATREREFFIDHPLVRIHFVIVMIQWTDLTSWEFEFSFSR
jgi:hypothetical protein